MVFHDTPTLRSLWNYSSLQPHTIVMVSLFLFCLEEFPLAGVMW